MNEKNIVLLLGSAGYIKDYAQFVAKSDTAELVVSIDIGKTAKHSLPENTEYFQVAKQTAAAEIVAICRENNYVVTAVANKTDYFELLHGTLCEIFGVPGPQAQSVEKLSNKVQMHELMVTQNLHFFRPQTIVSTLADVPSYFDKVQFPIVVKTKTGAKSRGVFTVKKPEDFPVIREQITTFLQNPKTDSVLIEEFIYGTQVTPVMYVNAKGKVHILALVDVVTGREVKQNHMQLVYRTTPSKTKENIRQKITFIMQKLVSAVGLKSVSLHPEFFVVGKNVYLIEVNVRVGGFRPTLMREAYGIDLEKISWEIAHDLPVSDAVTDSASCTVCEVWETESGTITELTIPKSKKIVEINQKLFVGDRYTAPPEAHVPLLNFAVKSEGDSLQHAKNIRKKFAITIE